MINWRVLIIILFVIGIVEASPSVIIDYPPNATIFNHTVDINVSSNETIGTGNWTYILDGAAGVSFTANTTIFVEQGEHNLTIIANNGTINCTNETFFTAAYIVVNVLNVETELNISSGINMRILSTTDSVLRSNTTNASGSNAFEGLSFDDYKIQAGGPAGSLYPHIYTYSFTFSVADTDVDVLLPQSTACQFITYQYVDSFYATPLDSVDVRIWKVDKILTEITSDTSGFITVCLVPGLTYILESSRSNYATSNFTDNAAVTSQFVQMVRETLATATDNPIEIHLYPQENILFKNDTVFFGMWIRDAGNALEEYRIVYGRSPEIVKDDSIAGASPNFKQIVAQGANPRGEYLTCIETDNCLRVNDWQSGTVYVGYFYKRIGEEGVWIMKTIRISDDLTEENFWTNYTSIANPKDNIHAFFASVGYGPEPDGGPSMGMVNFSLLMMVFAAVGAAKNGWGIMGAMIAFLGMNVILVLLALIQWWTILISVVMVIYLGNRFGSVFT